MIVPDSLLVDLTDLFAERQGHDSQASVGAPHGYKIGDCDWACELMTSQNERWYVHSIALQSSDLAANEPIVSAGANAWCVNAGLSDRATDWMNEKLKSIGRLTPNSRLVVMDSKCFGTVLTVLCSNLNLVASALQSWGNPPDSVVRDWQRQLVAIPHAADSCTAETLVTDDGVLIPMSSLIQGLKTDSLNASSEEKSEGSRPVPFRNACPPWPEGIALDRRKDSEYPSMQPLAEIIASPSIFNNVVNPSAGARSNSVARKKSHQRNLIAISVVAAVAGSLGVLGWLFSSGGEQVASIPKPSEPSTQADKARETIADAKKEAQVGNSMPAPDESEPELTLQTVPTLSDSASTPPVLTLESLLADLNPSSNKSIRLDSINTSSIIAEVLAPQESDTSNMSLLASEGLGDSDEKPAEADIADIKAEVSEGGEITLERPIELRGAVSKETIAIGKFVLAKACRCAVTLNVASELIVEPMESVTIEGTGKAMWKIAIEDEEPELLVVVASKPGARWQISASVGLRETRNSPPVFIAPRQAQNVCNRLGDYRQWLKSTIETRRTERSNNRGRSDSDFTGEIKKLERQDKEAEKAIERWKVIARLSHYFFDTNDLRLQLTAVANIRDGQQRK